ncbi:MAG TPA: hypothetical protein VFE25_16810 [Opitutaceae bacterium]|nr:hypothetical protein [Opitutaceae bacterium]
MLALALMAPLFCAASVSKKQVLEAIHTFDANAAGSLTSAKPAQAADDVVARASNTILKYSLESEDVVVDLGNDSVPWCDVKKGLSNMPDSSERGLLLAAYLSGSVKAQLSSGKQDPNPYPGWVAMLRLYHTIKIREGVKIPEVENLMARQADGTLESYAVDAVRRSTEKLRKAYGHSDAGTGQSVTAAQP